MSIIDITGLWCDDITFCQEECERMDCPRNQHNIRDRSIPHSFTIGIPSDCPKHPKEQPCVYETVTVVRCKNCLYRNNTGITNQWLPCMDNTCYPDDFFCARGVPRENG